LPQDARLALALIEARLGEYQDSGFSIKRDRGANVSDFQLAPQTVGALHAAIEKHFGVRGWRMFVRFYHEAIGLHPRPKMAGVTVPAVTNNDAKPLNCDAIEPGLVQAIMQAPSRVQQWLLAPPRDPPPWRAETTEQREEREFFEELGGWCG
jgi:hypothetical protein